MTGSSTGTVTLRGHRCVADAMIHRPKTLSAEATIGDVEIFFDDAHVHAALVVEDDGRLLSVLERADLAVIGSADADRVVRARTAKASRIGSLDGRTATGDEPLGIVWHRMRAAGRRRLAVIDARSQLLGLLCAKSSGLGFCSDADVAARAVR